MEKDNKIQLNSQSELALFRDNPNSLFALKKTEKIASALYLLSNLLSDSEPLKWQFRSIGLELVSDSINPKQAEKVSANLVRLISLLEVGRVAGLVSQMNFEIFKTELESVLQVVGSGASDLHSKGLLLSDHFFATDTVRPIANRSENFIPNTGVRFSPVSDKMSVKKDTPKPKPNRQEIILSLLKTNGQNSGDIASGGGLGIKDFVVAISGCSEKTIQRELADMVSKGQIKKAGEKRWSRYSLK
jgi:hypothetical protein